jgi:hypothetical protein
MDRFAVEVAARGLTGTAEVADNVDAAEVDAAESEPFDFTAPEAFSSRTIASTIAFNLMSSIKFSSHNNASTTPPTNGGTAQRDS